MTTTSPTNENAEVLTEAPTEDSPSKADAAKPDATALPPKKEEHKNIGNFTVGKTKGKGTFGKVKQGTHDPTNEKVAIKILEKEKIKDHADLERINREITILKKVRHPNVVQLYDMIENNDYLYLIMEYCSGGELFQHIVKNRRLNEQEACKMYAQILSGIEYIHKLGVVHRDLKPENLLLDHNNNIKLVDFGLSNLYKDGQKLKTACGSPCYAAPEMIRGERYYGLGADIWSSGVILYAMVCGYLPFEDQNTKKLYQKIIKGEYKMPSFLSEPAQDLIHHILNPDPTQRFSIDDIRAHPWYAVSEHQPPYTPPIYISKEPIPIDTKIMGMLDKDHGIDTAKAEQEIKRNRFNNITTTYYLLLKRKERAGMFRQQYNEEVKKLLRRGKKQANSPSPVPSDQPKSPNGTTMVTEQSNNDRKTPNLPNNQKQEAPPQQHQALPQIEDAPEMPPPIKKPATALPTKIAEEKGQGSSTQAADPNMGVIQAVQVVSPQNIKRIPNKTKTVETSANMKKQQVVVKGAKQGATTNNAPITIQVDKINRNTALTPTVYSGEPAERKQERSTVFSEENEGSQIAVPRPSRRANHSNDDRSKHVPAQMGRVNNPQMNSTVNRGFNKPPTTLQGGRNGHDSGGQTNLHNIQGTKGRAGYGALIQGNIQGYRNQNRAQANTVDPFAKVNPKARKLIESVERNRNNTSERRTGSTGGSSTQQVDLNMVVASPTNQIANQTAQNFYSPKRQQQQLKDQLGQNRPNIQIQIPGQQNIQTSRQQHLQAPSYQNYLFSEATTTHYRSPVNAAQPSNGQFSVRNGPGNQTVYTPTGQVSPQLNQQIAMQRQYQQQGRPAQGNLFNSKLVGAERKSQGPHTQHANPMQIIAQIHGQKAKQRAYSRAYESPRNGQFTQYTTRKTGTNKGASSTGNGISNQRRINQTIDVGSAMEHMDLDVGISTPNDLSTIQPDLTSPMGAPKLHQPVTPNLSMHQAVNGPTGGSTPNNFLMVNNQRNSHLKHHENNYVVNSANATPSNGNGAPKAFQKGGNFQPQSSNGFKNFNGPSSGGGYNGAMPPHQPVQLKNKKALRHNPQNYVKNQSVQITAGEESLGSTLTAHEAATFYSSAMNTQNILNSRRQPKRFGAGSVAGNNNSAMNGNNSAVSAGTNNNMGMNMAAGGAPGIGSKKGQQAKYKSNNSPTGFTKTFY